MSRIKPRILLVEDNDDHAELVHRNLTDQVGEAEIYRVSDGASALNYLFRREPYQDPIGSPEPVLILLDLRMPKVDGLEVLRQVKADEKLKRIPVVILTTSEADRDVVNAYDEHANAYLLKPASLDQFRPLMASLGLFWLSLNKRPRCLPAT